MINKFKPKSEFSRNVLTLMTGTTIAQAIPIAMSPILTRIYTPEDFGVLALFVAITSIFGNIANMRYELAIMLPKKDEDAINIFALGVVITFLISLILSVLVVLFNDFFVSLVQNKEIAVWLYFVPLSVFFIGIWNALNYFNNRKKNYKDIANATIVKSIILITVQLGIGFIKYGGSAGLIIGQVVSNMFANMKLLQNILKNRVLISKISKVKMIVLAKKYKDFPKYSMLSVFMNTLSTSSFSLFLSSFFSVGILGFYALTEKVLNVPIILIGKSISQVFFQEATQEKQHTGQIIKSFYKTVKKLILLGIPLFVFLYFSIEDLFAFVFGESWRIAGTYAKILMFLFFARFIVSPLTVTPIILERVKIDLYFQITMFVIIILTFLIGYVLKLEVTSLLILISIVYGMYYLIYLLILFYLVKSETTLC